MLPFSLLAELGDRLRWQASSSQGLGLQGRVGSSRPQSKGRALPGDCLLVSAPLVRVSLAVCPVLSASWLQGGALVPSTWHFVAAAAWGVRGVTRPCAAHPPSRLGL